MSTLRTRITSENMVSIPAEVQRRLGIGPGSFVSWEETEEGVVLRRVGRYTFEDLQAALFPHGPGRPRSLKALKAGVAASVKKRHGRSRG